MVMSAVAEDEWEGLLFCGKRCFNNSRRVVEAVAKKNSGRVPWQTDGPTPEINSIRLTALSNISGRQQTG